MISKNFHDAKIQGLSYEEINHKLIVQIELSTNKMVLLEFMQVVGWDLSPFEEQNVLFSLQEFTSTYIPEWIINDFNIPQDYLDLIFSGEHKVFYLEPSVGLGGYIVAKENQINNFIN